MNELGSYIRVKSNDSSWSTFVGCQGVACRALMIGSPRCSCGWTNGNRQTSTWSLQQDHTQTAPLGLTSPGTYPGLGLVWFMLTLTRSHTKASGWLCPAPRGGTSWRGESLDHICIYINIHRTIHVLLTVPLLNGCSFAFAT